MPRFTEQQLRDAVAQNDCYAQTLRHLGLCQTGGNNLTLKKYLALWQIDTSHFSSGRKRMARLRTPAMSCEQWFISGTRRNNTQSKERLYKAGIKKPYCELCGQNERWRGRRMSLILDHINGDPSDNRLENLRVVCPNCNATLDTHCGRNNRIKKTCNKQSGLHGRFGPRPNQRKVERPSYDILLSEVKEVGYCAVGRKYGVSDNAVRKWIRMYVKYT